MPSRSATWQSRRRPALGTAIAPRPSADSGNAHISRRDPRAHAESSSIKLSVFAGRAEELTLDHKNLHVRGYKEKGNINTRLQIAGAHAKERLRNMQIDCQNYAYEHGVDKPEIDQWTWP
jgi:hypothetical protein